MKISGLWVLLFALGTALMLLIGFSNGSSNPADIPLTNQIGSMTMTRTNRKFKEEHHDLKNDSSSGYVNMEDYRPIDPVPSSKASIKPGPIEHGSPLIPYIPKPSPPGHPHIVDSGSSN